MQKRQIEGSDSPSCVVLVVSCDGYRDLWSPFFKLFRRYWPDCEWPLLLGTNSLPCEHAETLKAGDDAAWSCRLRFFLQNTEADYVLLLLEDFFLDRTVSNVAVRNELQRLDSLKGTCLRLFPNPPLDYFSNGVGVLHAKAMFRVSLQAAIWNRQRLMDLLVDEESPWDFEVCGTRRAQAGGFYCVENAVIHYQHVVERGEWFRSAAQKYQAEEIGCEFAARPVMGVWKTWKKWPSNKARRMFRWMHSRWICARYPERLTHGN